MRKITIIHYLPVSYYPPTMNLVDIIEDKVDVQLISTLPDKGKLNYKPKKAEIQNPVCCHDKDASIFRLLKYGWFTLVCLIRLICKKPDSVMYYESISALPVYLYKRYFCGNVNVYIHYHEYSSEADYMEPGRLLFAKNHDIERNWLYKYAKWISQTNQQRLNMFMHENKMTRSIDTHVFPNYPPKSWWRKKKVHTGDVVKCVYVGSLSMKDTFVMEFCKWVISQKGRVTFDIYSYNFHGDTLQAITELKSDYINFHNMGLRYHEIPDVLDNYDVGLLLYRANSLNVKWCEPNKFYEYLICGLDVWYPKEMLMLHEMDKSQFAPQIKEMDFSSMDTFDGTVNKGVVDNSTYHWFADDVYNEFIYG